MAQPDLATYRQLPTGMYMKISDNSGPYAWDGTDMTLVDVEGGAEGGGDEIPDTFGTVAVDTVTTANPGSGWTVLASHACLAIDLSNELNIVDVEYRRNAAGETYPLLAGMGRVIEGITNSNQIGIRRIDQSNSQISLKYEYLNE